MTDQEELKALRAWSERIYHAIEHEMWAQDLIIDLVKIWNKVDAEKAPPEPTINRALAERMFGRPIDWEKTGWGNEDSI